MPPRSLATTVLAAALAVVAGNLLVLAFDVGGILVDGVPARFWDQDSYARLLRVRALASGGGWYDDVLPALNAPEGLALHWTRLPDLLLLAGAAPLRPWLPAERALEVAAFASGPVLGALAVLTVLWGAGRFASRTALAAMVLLVVVQRTLAYRFALGQADHHHLILLLHMLALAALVRLPGHLRPERPAAIAATAAVATLWVTPAGLVTLAAVVAVLGGAWVWRGGPAIKPLAACAAALALAAPLALLVERPLNEWATVSYDRYSVAHVGLALAIACGSAVLVAIQRASLAERRVARVWATALVAGSLLAVVLSLFPHLLRSPMALVDPKLRAVLEATVGELLPALPRDPGELASFVLDLGPALVAALYIAWRTPRARGEERTRLVLYAALLLVLLPITLAMRRGQEFLLAAAVFPWGEALAALGAGAAEAWRARRRPHAVVRVATLGVALAGSWVGGYAVAAGGWLEIRAPRRCHYAALAPWLRTAPGTVLTDVNSGPEVAWTSGRGVVAALFHRNAHGLRDASRVHFSRGDDRKARRVAAERRVSHIVLCRRLPPGDYALIAEHPGILYARLLRDRPPDWLIRVPLPAAVARDFALYRVRGATGDTPARPNADARSP